MSTPSTPATPGPTGAPQTPRDYGLLRWLAACTFVVILNETIIVNALPRLMVELRIDARTGQWLTSAFMLTLAVVIPVTGWFLQRVTTRQALALAMTVFCLGTALCALAPGFGVLLAGRVVQAAGTAVMLPLLMTTVMTLVAEEDRGRVVGNVTLAISVAPALGPAVSGVVLQLGSWRWMFALVLPVAAAIAVVSLRRAVDVGETTAGRVDSTSVLLTVAGFGPLVYGLSLLGGGGGSSLVPVAALVVGAAGVVAFVWRQKRLERPGSPVAPLLDLRTLAVPTYARGLALMAVGFMAMLGAMILLPLYLQDVRGLTELQTGLLVMPGGLAMGLLGPSVGRVYDARGARVLVVPGAVGLLVGLGLLSQVGVATPVGLVLAAHVLMMVSLAAVFTPVFTLSLGSLPAHLYSHGSSLLGALQQVGAAAGTAVLVAVMSARGASLARDGAGAVAAQSGGLQWAFAGAAVLALGVVALALTMPDRVRAVAPEEEPVSAAPV